jgi:hypothetical protein
MTITQGGSAMTRKLAGITLAVAALCACPGMDAAKADAVAGGLIAGAVVNTLIKGRLYDGRADIGPRYGYPYYGRPGWLAPGYTYVGYDGPGSWAPPYESGPAKICYWTNRPSPKGMKRVRVCY